MSGDFAAWVAGMGPGLANHLWQSTAFAACAWLLTLALRQNQARVRYAVWLAASLKFLVPFSLLMAAGNLLPHPRQAVAPVVYSAMDVVEEPFAEMPAFAAPAVHVVTMRERLEAAAPVGLFVVWVMGVGFVLLRWAYGWRSVRRTLRKAEVAREGREWEILRRVMGIVPGAKAPDHLGPIMPGLKSRPISEAKANAGVPRLARHTRSLGMTASSRVVVRSYPSGAWMGHTIELRLSDERMEPGVFGVWRPVLVWPRELSARLDDEHIKAIVAHEMAHVRRRDNLWAALHMFVETLFWFHPLVWWMESRMVKEREQACDEAVVYADGSSSFPPVPLRGTDGAPGHHTYPQSYAETYAEALLKTCRFCVESPLACVAGVTGADLKQRVVEIVTGRALVQMSWAKKLLLAVAAICVVAAPVVLGQAKAAQRLMLAAIKAAPRPLQTAAHDLQSVANNAGGAASAKLPSWDVISVKQSDTQKCQGMGMGKTPDGIEISCMPPALLVQQAYSVPEANRILGMPEWAKDSSRYDIRAKVAGADTAAFGRLGRDDMQRMLQALLEDRFQMKAHMEKRDMPVYDLVVAKGGAKLKQATAPESAGEPRLMRKPGEIEAVGAPAGSLPFLLSNEVGRAVVDKTGLSGKYDFTLTFAPASQAAPEAAGGASIFTALEELGLRLQPGKEPMAVLVIDQLEKPSVDGAELAPDADASEAQLSGEYRKWLDEDVHWLITPQERAEFLKLGTEKERDAFLSAFWEKRNAPGAANGAYKAEVYARIAYANDHFSRSRAKPGWATDRGHAYIRYGKPDSIESHPSPSLTGGYEVWHYNSLPAIGDNITLRFDRTTDDYQLSGQWPMVAAAYVPTMTFDVVSIHETKYDPNGTRVGGGFEPFNSSHLRFENMSFSNLVSAAFSHDDGQIDFTTIPRDSAYRLFTIEAKGGAAADEQLAKLTKEQVQLEQRHMLQVMLADRFHLKVHWETRDAKTYDLVVSKPGKLHTTGEGPSAEMVKAFGDRPIPPWLQQGSSMHGFEYLGFGATSSDIAKMLTALFNRPVNDKTGLTGKYYFHLKTYQTRADERKDDETNPWPPLETAIQDDLGLKLVPSRGPVQYLVVDHIETPTEN